MQIVENWSRVRGRVESWTPPSAEAPGLLRVHVTHVAPVRTSGGRQFPNLLDESTGETVSVQVPQRAADALTVTVGKDIELDVRRGRNGFFAGRHHMKGSEGAEGQ